MTEAAQRLAGTGVLDLPHALAVISEAVWCVTIVDTTMTRYRHEAYDRALTALDPASRQAGEVAFAGLRFVRNQMGYRADPADFFQPQPGPQRTRLRFSSISHCVAMVAGVRPLKHGQGEDVVADSPAAVGHLFDEDHGVGACPLAVDLGVQVGGAVDDEFLLLSGQGAGGHLEVREWHDGFSFCRGVLGQRLAWAGSSSAMPMRW
jgi:hypothetical protein